MNRNNAGNPRNYDFSRVPQNYLPRTRMYRPSSHMTTMGCDYIYPLFCEEVLPGDTFRLDVATFARMTNALVPFMSNLYLDWQFFFVPNRLVWQNWQKFCGEQENPEDSIEYTVPYIASAERATPTTKSATFSAKSIYDYFGLPMGVVIDDHDVNALPLRAYNLIWNEWYRDENLQNSVPVQKGDGPDFVDDYTLLKRGKRKDYFTSALPSPQKGPAVTLPLTEDFPVVGNGKTLGLRQTNTSYGSLYRSSNNLMIEKSSLGQNTGYVADNPTFVTSVGAFGVTTNKDASGLVAKASDVSLVTINELRQAFQMQKFFERLARGGTRYVEILKSMFGVTSPDARLQRPELLTSFTCPVQIYQNVQTSASIDGGSPQGNLAANGTIASAKFAFSKSFVEHGFVIGLASIRSDLLYQQGLHRMWSRKTRYDYFWPTFAHLGEQDIKNKEIYYQAPSVVDDNGVKVNGKAFGYQERWSEYKYGQHRVTGELRSTYSQSLDVWHLAQHFESLPTLSSAFIEENVPISRVLAISTSEVDPFKVDIAFDMVSVRPLPLYDIPGLVDHF